MSHDQVKSVGQVISSDINQQIQYEWKILGDCYSSKYIRGMYASLDRLIKLYRQRDIKI